MRRIVMLAAVTWLLSGCLPKSNDGQGGDEAVQVGRWVEADTTTFGADNVMGLLAGGSGGAKLFYVDTSKADGSVVELTAVVSWDDEATGDEFTLQLRCEERYLRNADGGNRQPDTCQYFEDFAMICPVPDAGDGAEMTCSSPTAQWINYPFRWVRTPPE